MMFPAEHCISRDYIAKIGFLRVKSLEMDFALSRLLVASYVRIDEFSDLEPSK